MSFPRYPKYKDSGVEWLGQVPEHWEVIAIKRLSPVRRGASPRPIDDPKYFDDDGEFAWVRIADVSACNGALRETPQTLSSLGSSLSVKLAPGDLFVSIAGTVGRPCITNIPACIHDGFVYFPALRLDPRFLYRIFEAGTCYGGLGKLGTQLNLNTDTIGSICVAAPPHNELSCVLEFLDRETAKIDALVAEQERLIELLKEKRQAVISHAVTKGLNPDAPMKDSGVEWLGEIPAHWEMYPCQRLKRPGTYITYGIVQAGPHCEDGVPYIRTSDMAGAVLREGDYLKTTKEIAASYSRSRVCEGDLVVAIRATVGKGLLVPSFLDGANLTQGTAKISPGERLLPAFLLEAFNSDYCQESIRRAAKGSTFLEITLDSLRRIQLAVPPRNEQQHIVSFLRSETARYTSLTAEAQRAIELLQERRTALISAAVTGQIDVRDVERRAA